MRSSVAGEGPPLLLLRPLGGSIDLWGRFRDRLVERFRVIAFDPPPRSSTRAMTGDALSLLDALSIERAHVFGLSLGGMVATWLAIDHPERVRGLVLASTMPWGLTARHASPGRVLSLGRCLACGDADRDACLVRRILSPGFVRAHPREVEAYATIARAHPSSRSALVTFLAAAARHDARSEMHRIAAPTLVLTGRRDALASPRSQRWLARAVPHARFETLDAGHDLSLEAPEETAAAVTRHFSTCS
jgi:pimeloyl-ACP methyl ester carboxylesterase